jgi:hypothetical protein
MTPHQEVAMAIHGWGTCPNLVAPAVGSLSQGHEGEEEGQEKEEETRQIPVVPGLLQRPLTHRMVMKTIGPRGRGPLASDGAVAAWTFHFRRDPVRHRK